ncbi:aldo/keto reductase [Rhizobiales bacterium TNE-4]|nr:aldo/keto reductase [Rhizobiales bacterium TNE-4]MBV1828843.1 aldo/keto reductase [Rhizobiales bacterium TNE-4]
MSLPFAPLVHAHGAAIPAIGLGTFLAQGEGCSEAVSFALKNGYRHIDTAPRYENEEAVGEGLRRSGVPRSEIFLTTKVWWDRLGEGDLQRSAEDSLRKLGVDQVDLLLIHWPNPEIPLAESIAALNDAKRRGYAKHIGVSNFTVAHLNEAWRLTQEPLVCNQCEWHPSLDQAKLRAVVRGYGMIFTAYSPIGRGVYGEIPAVSAIAKKYGKTASQIVLRWNVQHEGSVAIPKSVTPERMLSNLDIFDFTLTDAEMAALTALGSREGRLVKPDFAPAWD